MDYADFMHDVLAFYPNATVSQDSDGQLVIHTNLILLTSEDNYSIPEGKEVIQDMDEDLDACSFGCVCEPFDPEK